MCDLLIALSNGRGCEKDTSTQANFAFPIVLLDLISVSRQPSAYEQYTFRSILPRLTDVYLNSHIWKDISTRTDQSQLSQYRAP